MADAPPPSIAGALTSKPGIGLTVEQKDLAKLAAKLTAEADGKRLRLKLAANLRAAIAPAVKEVKAGALAIGHGGGSARVPGKKVPVSDSMSLGTAIAQGISTQTRLTGPRVGVKVRATKKGMPRGFKNAPQRMNRKSFKHPVFGRKVWVVQVGNPDYFDGPLKRDKALYRAAIIAAMEETAARLAKN